MSTTLQDWATWAFSPTYSAIIVTLLVSLFLPLIIHTYLYKSASNSKTPPTFLLLGPSGGGKTSLLTLFSTGAPAVTHTSQITASATCWLPDKTRAKEDRYRSENDEATKGKRSIRVVDTPGHGKLRQLALSSLTSGEKLKGLIYVLDSAAVSSAQGLTEAAEYLHDVLLVLQKRHTQATTSKTSSVSVLVATNKQDLFTALPAAVIKTRLQEEIGKVRATRSKGLMDSGIAMDSVDGAGGDEEASWLGEYGSSKFAFDQMLEVGVEVTVVGGNVRGDGDEGERADSWWDWIGENL